MIKFYNKHKILFKRIFFTILPSTIFFFIDKITFLNETLKIVLEIFILLFIVYIVYKISIQEEKEFNDLQDNLSTQKQYRIFQVLLSSLIEIEKIKRNLLKKDVLPDYKKNVLLYYPHNYIEQICSNIKINISNISDINLSSLSVSFIYQYPTFDSKWQWITRSNNTINQQLHEFIVNENSHSYFNYIVKNGFTSHFEHDKEKLVKENHYFISEHDQHSSVLGSIASYKISFMKNETTLCIGYLVISTYGRTFIEEKDNLTEIERFKGLLINTIIPSYRYLIETELGFMYERHKNMSVV